MKLSDYVALFLSTQGTCHVFAVSGGASVHLIQSLEDTPGITHLEAASVLITAVDNAKPILDKLLVRRPRHIIYPFCII